MSDIQVASSISGRCEKLSWHVGARRDIWVRLVTERLELDRQGATHVGKHSYSGEVASRVDVVRSAKHRLQTRNRLLEARRLGLVGAENHLDAVRIHEVLGNIWTEGVDHRHTS